MGRSFSGKWRACDFSRHVSRRRVEKEQVTGRCGSSLTNYHGHQTGARFNSIPDVSCRVLASRAPTTPSCRACHRRAPLPLTTFNIPTILFRNLAGNRAEVRPSNSGITSIRGCSTLYKYLPLHVDSGIKTNRGTSEVLVQPLAKRLEPNATIRN